MSRPTSGLPYFNEPQRQLCFRDHCKRCLSDTGSNWDAKQGMACLKSRAFHNQLPNHPASNIKNSTNARKSIVVGLNTV